MQKKSSLIVMGMGAAIALAPTATIASPTNITEAQLETTPLTENSDSTAFATLKPASQSASNIDDSPHLETRLALADLQPSVWEQSLFAPMTPENFAPEKSISSLNAESSRLVVSALAADADTELTEPETAAVSAELEDKAAEVKVAAVQMPTTVESINLETDLIKSEELNDPLDLEPALASALVAPVETYDEAVQVKDEAHDSDLQRIRAKLDAYLEASKIQSEATAIMTKAEMTPAILVAQFTDSASALIENTSVPNYLYSSPNPLQFPTTLEGVEIIGSQPITLEQAIDLAYRNNRDLQITGLGLEGSRFALREARTDLFPDLILTNSITVTENIAEDTDPTVVDFGLGPVTLAPGVDAPETDTDFSQAITLTYDVFASGGRSASIRSAKETVRFSELAVEIAQEDLKLAVATAYFALQNDIEDVRIASATVEEARQSLRDAQVRERAGVGTRFNVLQAEVALSEDEQILRSAISDQRTSQRALADLLNLPPRVDIAVTPAALVERWPLALEESIILAFQNRAELEQQLVQREINEQLRRLALSVLGPDIDFFASFSLADVIDDGESLDDFFQVGLSLTIPIFEGGEARAIAKQEEVNIAIAETTFADLINSIRLEVEDAHFDLESNFANIDTAELGVEQAKEALRLARLRFQAGVGTQLDVIAAQADLSDAEGNLVVAILGYNQAVAAMKRAISNVE
ncbi:MAG: TolC family protein [Cyanothece sp. SIO1E1]|nr:TolC family protein [Cyanothece sp. SIO1E1]